MDLVIATTTQITASTSEISVNGFFLFALIAPITMIVNFLIGYYVVKKF